MFYEIRRFSNSMDYRRYTRKRFQMSFDYVWYDPNNFPAPSDPIVVADLRVGLT